MTETDIAERLTAVEERAKSNTHRIDDLEKQQDAIQKLATAVEVMATAQEYQTKAIETTNANVSKLDTKLTALEQVPGKRWEQVVGLVIAAVVGYLCSQGGL